MANIWDWLTFCENEYKDRHFLHEEFFSIPYDSGPNLQDARLKKVTDLFGGPQVFGRKRIIEIGSQDGVFSLIFAFLGAEVFAVDMISKWLIHGKEISSIDVHWIRAFAEHLPFGDELFDMVFLGETLEHVLDPEPVLQEAVRVAKPGAKIVITVPWVAMKESTHLHEWPSFKWKAIFERYFTLETSEVFLERWYVVSGICNH